MMQEPLSFIFSYRACRLVSRILSVGIYFKIKPSKRNFLLLLFNSSPNKAVQINK